MDFTTHFCLMNAYNDFCLFSNSIDEISTHTHLPRYFQFLNDSIEAFQVQPMANKINTHHIYLFI